MRRLTLEGVPPAEAARVCLATPFAPASASPGPLPDREGSLRRSRGGPGGRVLALPGADAAVRGLGRAAMALDARAVTAALRAEVEEHGVLHTWQHVLRPVLVAVGERWAATGDGVEVEHLLSDCVAAVLREVADRAVDPPGRRPCCCPARRPRTTRCRCTPLAALGRARDRRPQLGPTSRASRSRRPCGARAGAAVRLVAAARHGRPDGARGPLPVTRRRPPSSSAGPGGGPTGCPPGHRRDRCRTPSSWSSAPSGLSGLPLAPSAVSGRL
jgi:hypothetical protein